jgi:hypothetical protein
MSTNHSPALAHRTEVAADLDNLAPQIDSGVLKHNGRWTLASVLLRLEPSNTELQISPHKLEDRL